jgi:hypothetical protein
MAVGERRRPPRRIGFGRIRFLEEVEESKIPTTGCFMSPLQGREILLNC